jgi:hypothetical protein
MTKRFAERRRVPRFWPVLPEVGILFVAGKNCSTGKATKKTTPGSSLQSDDRANNA